ncbi:MAG: Branched-chain amino acid transport system permease protein LivM [Myxococcaceae bacterium]|nr:Branched-chain amino acid transport system permease protein LivM [Myxococcaceae bacterium]MEA2745863.1 branched-chain amino acid transport system permease protein [Myxococcales bacterium]
MSAAPSKTKRPKRSSKLPFVAAGVLALVVLLDFFLRDLIPDSSIRQLLMLAACNVLVALSLNIINGMAGQFSIGHAGFIGIGGYTSAVMASHLHLALGGGEPTFAKSFVVVPLCLAASAGMAGMFGFMVGLPSLRLKGDYLAIVTLGFAEIFRLVIATAQASDAGSKGGIFTKIGSAISSLGGQNGYQGIANQGVPLYAGPFWVFGLAFVLGVIAWRIKFSGWGRALRALREDEIAGAAVGVDPTRYKVTSFVLAAVGAGIAGGLLALMRDGTPTVNPDNYNFAASFDAITMVILGGSGSVTGSAIGGVFITFTIKAIELLQSTSIVQDLRRSIEGLDLNALRMIIYAMVLVALMILRPEGLLGERELFQKKRPKVKV